MSLKALSWVFEQEIKPASSKLVLLAFADCANDQDHTAWPSLSTVLRMTSLDEKTISKALKHLLSTSYLLDTGRRTGATQQVKVYQLNGLPSDDEHYVYMLRRPDTGEFYIGVRSCYGNPATDTYMGSGAWPNKMQREKVALVKSIIGRFASRAEAEVYEAQLIERDLADPLCRNIGRPGKHPRFSGINTPVSPVEHPRFSGGTPPLLGDGTVTEPSMEPPTQSKARLAQEDTAMKFMTFWTAYPRKVGKPAAAKAFTKAIAKLPLADMLTALEKHKRSPQWVKDDGQFIPHPATWLNGERWADDVEIKPARPANPSNPDVLAIGFLRFTRDKPPLREQFESDGQHQTYLTAWRKHFGVTV